MSRPATEGPATKRPTIEGPTTKRPTIEVTATKGRAAQALGLREFHPFEAEVHE